MSSVEDELKENLARSSTLNTEQLIETVCCLRFFTDYVRNEKGDLPEKRFRIQEVYKVSKRWRAQLD